MIRNKQIENAIKIIRDLASKLEAGEKEKVARAIDCSYITIFRYCNGEVKKTSTAVKIIEGMKTIIAKREKTLQDV